MSKLSAPYAPEPKPRSDILPTLCAAKKCGNTTLSK